MAVGRELMCAAAVMIMIRSILWWSGGFWFLVLVVLLNQNKGSFRPQWVQLFLQWLPFVRSLYSFSSPSNCHHFIIKMIWPAAISRGIITPPVECFASVTESPGTILISSSHNCPHIILTQLSKPQDYSQRWPEYLFGNWSHTRPLFGQLGSKCFGHSNWYDVNAMNTHSRRSEYKYIHCYWVVHPRRSRDLPRKIFEPNEQPRIVMLIKTGSSTSPTG